VLYPPLDIHPFSPLSSFTMNKYLKSTEFIDWETESVKNKAAELTSGLNTDREKAVALYYFVRDRIKQNPYAPGFVPEDYKASVILQRGNGYCQHKALLLVALARAAGIPARPGYADFRDHCLSKKFRDMIGGDNLLIQHGYAELYIEDKWVHASPAYDLGTCNKMGFVPVEFDGIHDARDSAFNARGKPHMELVKDHGTYDDFPWDFILSYRQEWVNSIGREWGEYTDNVARHKKE
jgi:transglutaminase-like putative cysteine protease